MVTFCLLHSFKNVFSISRMPISFLILTTKGFCSVVIFETTEFSPEGKKKIDLSLWPGRMPWALAVMRYL